MFPLSGLFSKFLGILIGFIFQFSCQKIDLFKKHHLTSPRIPPSSVSSGLLAPCRSLQLCSRIQGKAFSLGPVFSMRIPGKPTCNKLPAASVPDSRQSFSFVPFQLKSYKESGKAPVGCRAAEPQWCPVHSAVCSGDFRPWFLPLSPAGTAQPELLSPRTGLCGGKLLPLQSQRSTRSGAPAFWFLRMWINLSFLLRSTLHHITNSGQFCFILVFQPG